MASSLGFEQALWLKEASSYNEQIDMSAAGIILPVRGDITFNQTIARVKTEHLRQSPFVQNEEDDQGLVSIEGDFGGVVPANQIGFVTLMKHLTGKITTSGTDPYTHVCDFNSDIYPGLSFAFHKGGGRYNYHGCQIAKVSFSFKVGGPIEYRVSVVGASEVITAVATVPTLTLLTATPYYLAEHITFKIDTVAESITEMSLEFTPELLVAEDQSYVVGSDTRANLARSGVTCTGTITRRHDKDGSGTTQSKFYDDFLNGSTAALLVDIDHPTDGANHNMEINLGNVKTESANFQAGGPGHTMETINFVAYDLDETGTTSNITITDTNATPATTAGTYDGTGT